MKISLIIFSKDRAMQMDLLLASIKKYCDIFQEINILYNVSDIFFEKGYQKLKENWQNINLVRETSFKQDLLSLVENSLDYVCILSDDCIFFKKVEKINLNTFCFIFGLGEDSVYSGTLGYFFKKPEFVRDDCLSWEWKKAEGEFSCPFMLAGNTYKKSDYFNCIKHLDFSNPSYLEVSCLDTWKINNPHEMPDWCSCPLEQSLVHSMNNRVQDFFKNGNGIFYPYSVYDLNKDYLNGKRVVLEELDFSNINGLHKEIDLIVR